LILMFGVALVSGLTPNIYFLLIPFAMISVFVLNVGVALLLATGMTFFKDVQFIYNVFMTALTYATPMFWDMSMIPDKYNWIFKINPLADIIIFVRSIILNNIYPGTDLVILMICIPIVFLLIGVTVFRKNQDKFILYI
jgi:ABC-type polysaccharide/polyol phosphate export permease